MAVPPGEGAGADPLTVGRPQLTGLNAPVLAHDWVVTGEIGTIRPTLPPCRSPDAFSLTGPRVGRNGPGAHNCGLRLFEVSATAILISFGRIPCLALHLDSISVATSPRRLAGIPRFLPEHGRTAWQSPSPVSNQRGSDRVSSMNASSTTAGIVTPRS
jgi:hypothetical protein